MHVFKVNKASWKNIVAEALRSRDFTHTESNIDPSKTHLNVNIGECMTPEQIQTVLGDKAKRKDAVCLLSTILTIPEEGKYWSRNKQIQYFKDMLPYIAKVIGGQMAYATIHFDETTPHMHVGIIPLTRDGRLCAREICNRNMLKALHPTVDTVSYEKYGAHVFEVDEETRQIQHDLGLSKDTMHQYRKKEYKNQILGEAMQTIDKALEAVQSDFVRTSHPVRRKKGEDKQEYKERRKEYIEVRKDVYEALTSFQMQYNTIPDKVRSEELRSDSLQKEVEMQREQQEMREAIQRHKANMQRQQAEMDRIINERAEAKFRKAMERKSDDYTKRLEEHCKQFGVEGKTVLDLFQEQEKQLHSRVMSRGFDR